MPSRNVKARLLHWTISHSRRVAELPGPWVKLLYTWIIPSVDNLGRMEGSPSVVAGMIFPRERYATPNQVAKWLQELHEASLICWYEADGDWFLYLKQHERHQTLRGNMTAESDFPEPPGTCDVCTQAYHGVRTCGSEGKGREGKKKGREEKCSDAGFGLFWDHYPKRRGKLDARKAWKQTADERPLDEELIAKVDELALSREWLKDNGQYVPYPATWLRRGGWDDEVD